MKQLSGFILLVALFISSHLTMFGCGGVAPESPEAVFSVDDAAEAESSEADEEDDVELEQVSQGLIAQATPTITYGFTEGAGKPNCNRTSTGQVCLVPRTSNKTIKWCVTNGDVVIGDPMPPTDVARIARVRTETQRAISNAMEKFGWTFTHMTDDNVSSPNACMSAGANVIISMSTTGLCAGGGTGANIENYVCVNPSSIHTGVTESLPGTYKTYDGAVILVDFDDAVTKASTTADTDKLLYHGLGHSMELVVGLGSQTTNSSLLSRRAVLPYSNTLGSSSSENCRALSFNMTDSGVFKTHPTLGCPD